MKVVETTSPDGGFSWVDISSPTFEDLSVIGTKYRLNNHNLQDCLEPDHLPKFEEGEDFNFIIFRMVLPDSPKGNSIKAITTKIAVFYNERLVVTIHRLPLEALATHFREQLMLGKLVSVNQLLLRILSKVQGSYTDLAGRLNTLIDEFEVKLFIRKTSAESIENLYLLKRKVGLSRRLLLLTGEIVNALQHRQKKSSELQDIRDNHAKLQLFFDQLSEDAINLVSIYLSYNAQKTNDVMKVLTIFSAFFLPLTFIVGIYGMNFEFMPELHWKAGYPGVLGLMLVLVIVIFIWFRRRRWI
jgi:magnesium transporter